MQAWIALIAVALLPTLRASEIESALGSAVMLLPSEPFGHGIMDVVIPPVRTVCTCKATVTFEPPNGMVMCPAPQQSLMGCQIVWEDSPAPTDGNCEVVGSNCTTQSGSTCGYNPPELNLNLMNCWAGGVFMTATGLQSGGRFWHEDDDGISFDPDFTAPCKLEAPAGINKYEINFFAAATGGASLATFTITLNCANCTPH